MHKCSCGYVFISLGYTPRSRTVESYGNAVFNILTVFQSGCATFHFHQQCLGAPISLCSQHLLLCHFDSSHAGGYDVVSHGGFDLHFPDGSSFHVLTGHFCIFFGETSIQILESFKNWVIYLFIIEL